MAKEEIARIEQFPPLSQCFQKSAAAEGSKSIYMRGRVKKTWLKKKLLMFYPNFYLDVFKSFAVDLSDVGKGNPFTWWEFKGYMFIH